MKFISTRGQCLPHSFGEAVAAGLAPDGGLFLPVRLPDLAPRLIEWQGLGYAELCERFLRLFATDLPPEELSALVARAYAGFRHPEIAPLRKLDRGLYVLELFHGPTLAFKDFALQLLGRLYERQCRVTGGSINVLGATSGDTGAAAIHGLLGRPHTSIFILYPDGRVSPLQERQMTCTGAANVHALAIDGTFDDAQRVLKVLFGDREFASRHRLSAVNSINLARILAQCVYYLHAWLRLPAEERGNVEFVVPTGNFGNVLAGWLLARMGVPMAGLHVATNRNDILHRFFSTGEYRVGEVAPSLAPSMDIQVASNFERWLYYHLGGDAVRVRATMAQLATGGSFKVENLDRGLFTSSRADDAEITGVIRRVHQRYGYVLDPHTACGFAATDSGRTRIVLATAHPAKFPSAIRDAIGHEVTDPALEELKSRSVVKHCLPATVDAVRAYLDAHATA